MVVPQVNHMSSLSFSKLNTTAGRSFFGWQNKSVMRFGSKSSGWRELFTLLDFRSFFKIFRIVAKSMPHPVGVFCLLPHPSKCHIRPKITKNYYFHNKIWNPWELRQVGRWRGLSFFLWRHGLLPCPSLPRLPCTTRRLPVGPGPWAHWRGDFGLYGCHLFFWWVSARSDPTIKSAWRPPNMDMYSGCYIQNINIFSRFG